MRDLVLTTKKLAYSTFLRCSTAPAMMMRPNDTPQFHYSLDPPWKTFPWWQCSVTGGTYCRFVVWWERKWRKRSCRHNITTWSTLSADTESHCLNTLLFNQSVIILRNVRAMFNCSVSYLNCFPLSEMLFLCMYFNEEGRKTIEF